MRSSFATVVCALAAASVLPLGGCEPSPGTRPPNVLLVVFDTTRADVVSSKENGRPVTPHVDRLASEGARFTQAFTTCFWTQPSHASLFTGLYPSEHGSTTPERPLAADVETIAERLAASGYRTAAFVSNPWVSLERGFGQGFQRFAETWRQQPVRGTDRMLELGAVEAAESWLQEDAAAQAPFFLF